MAVQELEDYKKKCELLQKQNSSLKSQLKSVRATVVNNNTSNNMFKLEPDSKSFDIYKGDVQHWVFGSHF
jgi:cell fate regulator YaaT (PSP1 superfamily)